METSGGRGRGGGGGEVGGGLAVAFPAFASRPVGIRLTDNDSGVKEESGIKISVDNGNGDGLKRRKTGESPPAPIFNFAADATASLLVQDLFWVPRNASHFLWLWPASQFLFCDAARNAEFAAKSEGEKSQLDPVEDRARIRQNMGMITGMITESDGNWV